MPFFEEFIRAVSILEEYGQTEDALWLIDLIQAADSSKIDLLEIDPFLYPNEDNFSSFQELSISLLYRNEDYVTLLRYFDTLDLTPFSSKELFFASSAVIKTNSILPVRDRIEAELIRRSRNPPCNSFCLYNLGVLWKLKHDSRCESAFVSSIQQFPYFWSCWLELSGLFLHSSEKSVSTITPPLCCILKNFFQLYATNHFLQSQTPKLLFDTLSSFFPTSNFLHIQLAQYLYNHSQFEESLSTLQSVEFHSIHSIYDRSPFEFLLCNLFFIQEDAEALLRLSYHLEHTSSQPLIEGSYWSLVGQHQKSILCFTRMLEHFPDCYDAWLLLGHEYISLRMLKEAIACYMKTTHINQADYRGFFALAQAYSHDINDQMAYYFFMRTLSIQPQLPRGWLSLGDFFVARNEVKKAIDAYQRGQRCTEFDEKEARMCLFRLCQLQLHEGVDTRENLENWIKRSRKAKDLTLFSPEGMEILRIVFQRFLGRQELSLSLQLQQQALNKIEEYAIEMAQSKGGTTEIKRDNSLNLDYSTELWSLVDFLLSDFTNNQAVANLLSKNENTNESSNVATISYLASNFHGSAIAHRGDRNTQMTDWIQTINFDNSDSSSDVTMSIDFVFYSNKQLN